MTETRLADADFATDTSAAGAPMVAAALLELLPGFGSGSLADTVAVLLTLPVEAAVTTSVTVAEPPFAKLLIEHTTIDVPVQVSVVDETDAKVTPVGSVSVTFTLLAASGPAFATTSV